MNYVINKWRNFGVEYWLTGEYWNESYHSSRKDGMIIYLEIGEHRTSPSWEISIESYKNPNGEEKISLYTRFPEDYCEQEKYLAWDRTEIDEDFKTLQDASDYAMKEVVAYLKRNRIS